MSRFFVLGCLSDRCRDKCEISFAKIKDFFHQDLRSSAAIPPGMCSGSGSGLGQIKIRIRDEHPGSYFRAA
jgi:hypothetical protein